MLTRAVRRQSIVDAVAPVVEALEGRRLMAGVVQTLPFALEFDKARGGIVDKDGSGTGLTLIPGNRLGTEYNASKIDLRAGAGVLNIRTSGNSSAGSNFEADNTLVNALATQFNALTGAFSISTTIRTPADSFDATFEQGGILYGPTQDNYIKLVVGWGASGPQIQLLDEQSTDGVNFTHSLGAGAITNLDTFAGIDEIELVLSGDPGTGKFNAFYRLNNGALRKADGELTIGSSAAPTFFRSTARAGLIATHKNDSGGISVGFDRFAIERGGVTVTRPKVTASRPANGAVGVRRDAFVALDIAVADVGAGVDASTLTDATVNLKRTSDGALIPAVLNTTGGGDAIILQPSVLLDASTQYTFTLTTGVKDTSGTSFEAYTSSFTTGTTGGEVNPTIAFEKVELGSAQFREYASVRIGPDSRLYASTLDGQIIRWRIKSDGTLSNREVINTVKNRNGASRFITGFDFDPRSTEDNVILWVNHGERAFENATDWTGKISKLYGANLERYADIVVGLPRSIRDHLTNQPSFGPDGGLYFPQGSNTAMGNSDSTWGGRSEDLLNAAVLRLDIAKVEAYVDANGTALNVRTDSVGNYSPFKKTSPLRIWASGVRNAYDLLWHSNGHLYAPTNGSASGGSTPTTPTENPYANNRIDFSENGPYTGPIVAGANRVNQTQPDLLFDIEAGGYYGHPNPTRSEFVMNGGNPTSGVDSLEVAAYPVGTQPDRNYRGTAYNFGNNYSPDGVAEYTYGGSFNGALEGKMLVARYSGGDDILVMNLDEDGNVDGTETGISGLTGFVDPLDLAVDSRQGNIYVVEYGAQKITLLRPVQPGSIAQPSTSQLLFVDPTGGDASVRRDLTITNAGTTPLNIPTGGIRLAGRSASLFDLEDVPTIPVRLEAGESLTFGVRFSAPAGTERTIRSASITIESDDISSPVRSIALRGLPTAGTDGANEPSLQRVLELYGLGTKAGDSNPDDTFLDLPLDTPNDEIIASQFVKAGGGPVTAVPIAAFAVNKDPAVRVGYYQPGLAGSGDELFTIDADDRQSVDPEALGTVKFNPGVSPFSFYGTFPGFTNSDGTNRVVYGEDALNTWEPTAANRRKVRVYPVKDTAGKVTANSYIVAFEEFTSGYDYQDVVLLVRNVKPVTTLQPQIALTNTDASPFGDRLVMSRIGNPLVSDPSIVTDSHETSTVRITNTGTASLVVSGVTVDGPFSAATGGFTLAAGASRDLAVTFTRNSGTSRVQEGSLTIASNDPNEASRRIEIVGYYSTYPEIEPGGAITEPDLQELVSMFGYSTQITFSGEDVDTGGRVDPVGEEVLAPYFVAADTGQPVIVQQLAAYHQSGNTATTRWFAKGTPGTSTTLFTSEADEAQTVFPHKNNASTFSTASFKPGVAFGLRIDNEYSDPTLNDQEQSGGGYGHHVRVFPARDRNGQIIPDTYLAGLDYSSINFDYQDNLYLIRNVRPERLPGTPVGLGGLFIGSGTLLTWGPGTGATSYNVYRSSTASGAYSQLNDDPITATNYTDVTALAGTAYFYRVTGVNSGGLESVAHSVLVTT